MIKSFALKVIDLLDGLAKFWFPLFCFLLFLYLLLSLGFESLTPYSLNAKEKIALAIGLLSLTIPSFIYIKNKDDKLKERNHEMENTLKILHGMQEHLVDIYTSIPGFIGEFFSEEVMLHGGAVSRSFPTLAIDELLELVKGVNVLKNQDEDFVSNISKTLPEIELLKSKHLELIKKINVVQNSRELPLCKIIKEAVSKEDYFVSGPLSPYPKLFSELSVIKDLSGNYRKNLYTCINRIFEFNLDTQRKLEGSKSIKIRHYLKHVYKVDSSHCLKLSFMELAFDVNQKIESERHKRNMTKVKNMDQ